MIRVNEVNLKLDESEDRLKYRIGKKLNIRPEDILEYRIVKKSVDARKKDNIKFVYAVDIKTIKDEYLLKSKKAVPSNIVEYEYVKMGMEQLNHRPVIVGSGPCGMFCALTLAQMGYKPIIIERGKDVDERIKDVEDFWKNRNLNINSNVQFGEGGAGTFSDGKLTTQIKNTRCQKVLQEFVAFGAPKEILYNSKPHIGTDIIRDVIKNIRIYIQQLGGEFRFNTTLTDIKVEENKIVAIELNNQTWLPTDICVLALGHSARDTFEMLHKSNIRIEQKPFAMGVRIEHLQEWINKSQYGDFYDNPNLGASEYKVTYNKGDRSVYSFCVCPGGFVVASTSEKDMVVTNGMSLHKRDGVNVNSAILVNITPDDFESNNPLAGIRLQQQLERLAYDLGGENYNAPVQTVGDFLQNKPTTEIGVVKPTYKPDVTKTNIRESLPKFMADSIADAINYFGTKIEKFNHPDALITGIETRSSSPIRILRDKQYQSNIEGIYPAGEGAGYAGGITSSAVDGIQAAEIIAQKYANLK
ncbi:MAG: hypothetical protein BEN19_02025 [Epulopiscium sp. Nuni2H_MBin003]|nr:MAG: hypothetical protein BEN19_02025 [Epulopiscium sp. Nuni2H_MBin003]